jgi:alpha-amylase
MAVGIATPPLVSAQQVSNPVTLQWFESSWRNMERRAPDLFGAGYGNVWAPPPGRAVYLPQGGGIGYDPYDRFDLGKPRDPTLYGTENQFVSAIRSVQKFGGNAYVDYVHHHVGSFDIGLNGYTYPQSLINQGAPYLQDRADYPGFELSDPFTRPGEPAHRDTYGFLNPGDPRRPPGGNPLAPFEYWFRLGENLVTVDLTSGRQTIRQPVAANAQNTRQAPNAWAIPTTTIGPNGLVGADTKLRQANVIDPNNARFYPDLQGPVRQVVDRGVTYNVYDFNASNPLAGDATPETTLGYMQRYAQWMTQVVGVDGLRIDAARHVPLGINDPIWNPNSLDVPKEIDRATAGSSRRFNLDGTRRNAFNFQEVFAYDSGQLASFVRKSQQPGDTVNPNRDVLDFSMWAAMAQNMSGNGLNNDWFNIRSASLNAVINNTLNPNIANNGQNGIGFVYNHDEGVSPPGLGASIVLDNVAHAWVLMRPGNAYVYYRSNEFNRSNNNLFFLKNARGDALGGTFGNIITTLVDVRNSYGRGDFVQRWIDNEGAGGVRLAASAIYAFERQGSAIVGLNIGFNPGVTTRNITTSFAQGTRLEEVTGNWQDPSGLVPRVVTVGSGGQMSLTIPWNNSANGNKGYVVYGLPLPRGNVSLSNVTQTLDETPTAGTNGTARISDIQVIGSDTFEVRLDTNNVVLADGFIDLRARGDRAMLKINDGFDANANGSPDFPSSAASNATRYGFENFLTESSPGTSNSLSGTGVYRQTVNAAALGEGYHYLTIRAWRQQGATENEVYKDFRQTLYVDRLDPVSSVDSTGQFPFQSLDTSRDIRIKSDDKTADSVHVLFDIPTSLSNSQILSLIGPSTLSQRIDSDLFGIQQTNVGSGNHTVVTVTTEITGRFSIQRFSGRSITTSRGLGLGDVDFTGSRNIADVSTFNSILYSNLNPIPQFNPAADVNGNGVVDNNDLYNLASVFPGADGTTLNAIRNAIRQRGDLNNDTLANAADIDFLYLNRNSSSWLFDMNADGSPANQADVDTLVRTVLQTQYGDANLDGRVDATDLDILAANFDQPGRGWATADFTGSTTTNLGDFFLLAQNWGFGVPGGLGAASVVLGGDTFVVPEPTTLALMGMTATLTLRRRRSRR